MLEKTIINALRPAAIQMIKECIEAQNITLRNVQVKINNEPINEVSGFFHKEYERIIKLVGNDIPTMLVGPAGSGKNVCVKQVAEALGLEMYYTNSVTNEFKITGFVDAGGNYHETEFYKAFKNGGLFFLDEIDTSDPSALIILNSAISNKYVTFPHEKVECNPNFRCIAAANTWGNGRDFQYVGRNALDGASLDRFVALEFDYDENLESTLYPNQEILNFIWNIRHVARKNQIRHIFSTRTIKYAYEMQKADFDLETIVRSVIIKGMNADDINIIKNDVEINCQNNAYFNKMTELIDDYSY